MLDALFCALVLHPTFRPLFMTNYSPSMLNARDASVSLNHAFFALDPVLITDAYRQYIRSEEETGLSSVFARIQGYLASCAVQLLPHKDGEPILEGSLTFDATPETMLMKQMLNICHDSMAAVGQCAQTSMFFDSYRESMKEYRRGEKERTCTSYVCPNTCDYCQKSVDETKLMRCSRCGFAGGSARHALGKKGAFARGTGRSRTDSRKRRTRLFALMPRSGTSRSCLGRRMIDRGFLWALRFRTHGPLQNISRWDTIMLIQVLRIFDHRRSAASWPRVESIPRQVSPSSQLHPIEMDGCNLL